MKSLHFAYEAYSRKCITVKNVGFTAWSKAYMKLAYHSEQPREIKRTLHYTLDNWRFLYQFKMAKRCI